MRPVTRRALVIGVAVILAGCGTTGTPAPSSSDAAASPGGSPVALGPTPALTLTPAPTSPSGFAFPYAAGTVATPGDLRLHDDNFRSLYSPASGSTKQGPTYNLVGAGDTTTTSPPKVPDASLDLIADAGSPVVPLAAGTVLAAWPECQTVLVDHGGGVWVEYVHLAVSVTWGMSVTRSTVLGTVEPKPGQGATLPCGLTSNAAHVHIAFLTGSGTTGQYVSMAGRVLCGHTVTTAGGIDDLTAGPGAPFTIPVCAGDGTSTPTPVTAPVLSGAWVAPADGAKLTTSVLTLSAKPTVTPTTLAVTKVAFSIAWGSTTKAVCSATKADSGGVWSCTLDLARLGVTPGPLTLSFDVYDTAGDAARSPAGTRTVSLAASWTKPIRIVAADCTSVAAGIDSTSRYHLVAGCGANVRYAVAASDGSWATTVFPHPPNRLEIDPKIAFRGNIVFVAYTRVAPDEGCGGGYSDVGVYYRWRTLPDGTWSAPTRIGLANDSLESFREAGGTIHATVSGADGRVYYETLMGTTYHRYLIPGAFAGAFGGAYLRVGSDGVARFAYATGDSIRYAVFTGSGFSTTQIVRTSFDAGNPVFVLDANDRPLLLWTHNAAGGGGCATPGPSPDDGTYFARTSSGAWTSSRFTTRVGGTSLTLDETTGNVHALVASDGLRYFVRSPSGTWTSATLVTGQVLSPSILLDPAAGTLLVVYIRAANLGGSSAIYALTKPGVRP
jgi:hypothetical protein